MTRPERYQTVSRCVDVLDGGEASEPYYRDEHGEKITDKNTLKKIIADYVFNNPYDIIKKRKRVTREERIQTAYPLI